MGNGLLTNKSTSGTSFDAKPTAKKTSQPSLSPILGFAKT